MIPDEAVDAAAKWLHDIDCRSAVHSGHPAEIECYGWKDEAGELVSIVAPHLMASVLAECDRTDTETNEALQGDLIDRIRAAIEAATHGDD